MLRSLLQNKAGQLKVTNFEKLQRSLYTPSPQGSEIGSYKISSQALIES
jgi:hypothetical protein